MKKMNLNNWLILFVLLLFGFTSQAQSSNLKIISTSDAVPITVDNTNTIVSTLLPESMNNPTPVSAMERSKVIYESHTNTTITTTQLDNMLEVNIPNRDMWQQIRSVRTDPFEIQHLDALINKMNYHL